jgi:hypothetical protein
MITASYREASEDWGGFQTGRIIAQPFLHTKKFLTLPEKFLRLAPKFSGEGALADRFGVIRCACAIKFRSLTERDDEVVLRSPTDPRSISRRDTS